MLSSIFSKYSNIDTHLILDIDAQNAFVNPACVDGWGTYKTKKTADKNIALLNKFKRFGVDVAHVFMHEHDDDDYITAHSGFYDKTIGKNKNDWIIDKHNDALFDDPKNRKQIKRSRKKILWFMGFAASLCVHDSVIKATRLGRYGVVVLKDCIEDGDLPREYKADKHKALIEMNIAGAHIATSQEALQYFNNISTFTL